MTDTGTPETTFTASGAAKACGVGRSTVHRYLEQGRLPGAVRDDEGVWQIPLSALLSAGWTPGRSPSTVDTDRGHAPGGAQDTARPVPAEVHHLTVELERARAEARVHAARAEALEEVVAVYRRMLEAPQNHAPTESGLDRPQAAAQAIPAPTPHPDPASASPGTPWAGRPQAGRFRRAWNVLRY